MMLIGSEGRTPTYAGILSLSAVVLRADFGDTSSCEQPAAASGKQEEVKMSVSYKSKSAAIKSARKTLGADAQNSIDFDVFQIEAGSVAGQWGWEPKTSGKTFGELVETAEVVDGLPNVNLILSTEDFDIGPVLAENARAVAQEEANNYDRPVTIRNELTDEVIEVVEPTPSPEGEAEAPAEEPAPALEESFPAEEAPARDFKAEIDALKEKHSDEMFDLKERQRAELAALKAEFDAAKPTRVVKSAETRARSMKVDGPSGKTAEVIELAKRPEGVTVAELIALTGWTKAPWSWNFQNPKGNGWAQKFGYKFRSEKGEDRKVRYFLTAE
jgi:hypothetical protein